MTIAIITESGVRKVAPLVIVAQQAAAAAQFYAQAAAAAADGNIYPDYATGNAATVAGEYFYVASAAALDLYVHGTATPVVKLPVLDLASGNLGVGTASPSAKLHVLAANATLVTIEATNASATDTQLRILTPDRDYRVGQNIGGAGVGTFVVYDVTAGAPRLVIDGGGIMRPGGDNSQSLGAGSFRWSVVYAATGSINTSDRDDKEQIGDIPDEWLDAWADVEWSRFKFKGRTRWHVGLVAQQVYEAFAAREIDAFDIGLCCFDEWEAVDAIEEVRDENGEIVTPFQPARDAGARWGLRYSECEAMEAAYQRREIAALKAQVAAP